MKSLRKSLNGSQKDLRSHISTPLPLPAVSKPAGSVVPPQKVIRALSGYRPNAPQELPFKKGDFFYVIRDVNEGGSWYEAHNPVTGARGLVPRSMFEEFQKDNAPLRQSAPGGAPGSPTSPPKAAAMPMRRSAPAPKSNVFYAIVIHDFAAERADELDAKKGDAITVVAQSNREWFVAKPIGRLGRPGLIPVTFVEVHDPATGQAISDIDALMDSGDLPKVEDWKRQMLTYKQNSIALGVIDAPGNRESVPNSPFMASQPPPPPMQQSSPFLPQSQPELRVQGPSPNKQNYGPSDIPPPMAQEEERLLPEGLLLSADVVTFHFENDDFWFRINATYQPFPPPNSRAYPPAMQLILFRVYNDFYDFQVNLLESYPKEAGRQPPNPRILPYMPGPASDVDNTLSATRRAELDEYLHQLCQLRNVGARYILEHEIVRQFFAVKPGDMRNTVDPRGQEVEDLLDQGDYGEEPPMGYNDERLDDRMNQMTIDEEERLRSEGSDYEDEGYAPSPQRRMEQQQQRHPYANGGRMTPSDDLRLHAISQNHQRNGSNSSFQQYNQPPRSRSPYSQTDSPAGSRSNSPSRGFNNSQYASPQPFSQPSRWMDNAPPTTASSTSSGRSPPTVSGGRSRSGSTAAPSISATNSQTAFVKIKIFDRLADDLIAIRVHPKVSHAELMEKVQSRLGDVTTLRFRDSQSDQYVMLSTDRELRAWMEGTDRYVLYAD